MERKLFKGNVVVVKTALGLLGNSRGARGVVVDEYDLGDGPGVFVIFENGNYDGFSTFDQENFIAKHGHDLEIEAYEFLNVMRLSTDFMSGRFKTVFNK